MHYVTTYYFRRSKSLQNWTKNETIVFLFSALTSMAAGGGAAFLYSAPDFAAKAEKQEV